jgi:hypothetical protein
VHGVHRICYGTGMMEVHGVKNRPTDWTGSRQQHEVKSNIPDINTETWWDEGERETQGLCDEMTL